MAELSGLTLSEAKAKLERMASHVKNVKVEGQKIAERGMIATANYVGAGIAGAMAGKWGEGPEREVFIPNTEIPVDGLIGFLGTLAGVAGLAGDESAPVTALFSSFGGYRFGRSVEEKVAKGEKPKAA